MHYTTVTSKGQVTIPIEFRQMFGIAGGDQVQFSEVEGRLVIEKAKRPSLMDLSGCLPKSPRAYTIEEMDEAVVRALGEKYAK